MWRETPRFPVSDNPVFRAESIVGGVVSSALPSIMRVAVRAVAVIAVVFTASGLAIGAINPPECPTSGHPGFRISKISTNLCFQDLTKKYRHLYVPSPDSSVVLIVDGYEGRFVKHGKTLGQPFKVAEDEDIIWSSDSTAIMVTVNLERVYSAPL